MKKYTLILIILAIVFCTNATFAQTVPESSLQGKINLKSPSTVSRNASQDSLSNSSEFANNPIINGYMGAMGNILNNNSNSSYNIQEQQKQQAENARQQAKRFDQ